MTEKTYNVFTISNSKLTPEEQVLESQYCYLEEIFHPYVTYLKNNNGMVKTDNFIEDFDPIGLQVISDMEESGIARRMVDKGTRTRKPVDDFMLISFEHWKMFYSAPAILTSKE